MADQRVEDLAIKKSEQPEKPKPVIEKVPKKILDSMDKLREDKNKMLNQMLSVSFQVVELQKQQLEITEKIKNNSMAFRDRVKNAASKLKLQKKKNYRWQFNGKDSFIGQIIPEKPKEPKK